jgi:Ankyrin repeats (3 copies)/Ankyrin repeat
VHGELQIIEHFLGFMDHLEFIKKLLEAAADVNDRAKDNTEVRTVFTQQWLNEDGATPFLRAAQSSDLEVMKLLLAYGADPTIPTTSKVTALQVAAGIGWVDGNTYEWSEQENVEAVKMLLDLGPDPNVVAETGRTALHGAALKGRTAIIQLLVDHGAKLDVRDYGTTGHRQDRQAGAPHVAAGRLCRWAGENRHADGDRSSRSGEPPPQAHAGARPSCATGGPDGGDRFSAREN